LSDIRVWVTGIGVISPLACNSVRHFDRLLSGDSAVVRLDGLQYRNFPPILQARVAGFDRREMIPDRMLRKLLSPSPGFAVAAATEALRDAQLLGADLTECGLYVGSVCLEANPDAFIPALRESVDHAGQVDPDRFARNGMKLIDPLFLVRSLPNAGLCSIAIQHQVLGPNANLTNGPVSGLQAVIAAMEAIRRGDAEIALAGAYSSLLQMDCIVDHLLAGRLAGAADLPSRCCRPFDRARSGYALSEGASFLLLESAAHALRRDQTSYGEILSYGESASPARLLHPNGEEDGALGDAARRALAREPDPIDLVFMDGLALEADDDREAAAYTNLFGKSGPAVTASTGSIGFAGAAGASFALANAFLAMDRQTAPPMINCDEPLPQYELRVLHQAYRGPLHRVLVWSSDRGIKNAAVVVGCVEQ
jgi:3-oxoacyl-[acyl-carrier-protein] synthase II